ncbi:MAG: AAA family ATPase [Oligoflexales bacterium]
MSESAKTRVYACVRIEVDQPLVLKVLNYSHPSPSAIARFKYEYEIAKKFSSQYVVKAFDMVEIVHSFGFFMEHGPPCLASQFKEPLQLKDFLELAIGCVEALDHVHQQQIVHKDINPSNVLWDPVQKIAKIIDFGISSQLSHEKIENKNTHALEGSLPYLSPEQTGRLNRDLDYRSDYYSLGISLYKMLTGSTPFSANGVLKWIHHHITKTPPNPREIRPEIPGILAEIILKLIEKDASGRYQSKATLLSDLKNCQDQWLKEGKINHFDIAQNDVSQKFYVPTNLYGREEEIRVLDSNLSKVMNGQQRLVVVVGYSGVGKTALIRELQGSILNRGGYFVEGKYESLKRNIPFYGFAQAVDNIIKLVLSDSEEKILKIKTKLNSELKSSFPILVDLIPNLKELLSIETDFVDQEQIDKNRFYLIFNKLISIIASSDCPLVIFLDDLQWADSATLDMLAEWYSNSSNLKKVLMVCSYRENEIKTGSNLHEFLGSLELSENVQKLSIGPLGLPNVRSVIAKTLTRTDEEVNDISTIVYEKTKGNPFFIKKMLYYFYEKNYIWFDQENGNWSWDLKKLENAEVSNNVVDFLIENFQSLNKNTLRMLTLAASIGDNFDFSILFKITDFPKKEIFDCLWEAMVNKLIFPLDAEYKYIKLNNIGNADSIKKVKFKFQHDKVHEASYALLNTDSKMKIHLDIARILYKNNKNILSKDSLGEITKHYNLAINLIDSKLADC